MRLCIFAAEDCAVDGGRGLHLARVLRVHVRARAEAELDGDADA
eukprot:CAMPEP_0195148758 /NCGR_PEP_ID=MMETSP0448-20130528/175838_1 /TAXON_ID=66468 /ORGANISM="Heterocapsa triquestra, Strain CCMP 448" /LENGTH=43 /DNA_ID= /DNA_START= /DNA_END= /DNA_ORIENTATION=